VQEVIDMAGVKWRDAVEQERVLGVGQDRSLWCAVPLGE
jgi:hypothetical protein